MGGQVEAWYVRSSASAGSQRPQRTDEACLFPSRANPGGHDHSISSSINSMLLEYLFIFCMYFLHFFFVCIFAFLAKVAQTVVVYDNTVGYFDQGSLDMRVRLIQESLIARGEGRKGRW